VINYLFFDFFFHFQKKYIPTPNRIYTPMNIYIGFTLSPKSHAMKRLVAVLNYLFLLIYANTTSTANMIMTIMCIGMPNKGYQLEMFSLPIRLSKKYQVKQVNHEVGKKHRRKSTYNNPNVHILIIIPCKYLVIIIPCKYLVKHLLHQFINGFLGISRFSEMRNHPMNNLTNSQIIFALNLIQILLILRGGAK